MEDLTSVIEDAVSDVEMEVGPDLDPDPAPDAPEPAQDAPVSTTEAAPDTTPAHDSSVASPASKQAPAPTQDEFEKKIGIAANSSSGRENRIPYSRVKQIVTKRENEITKQVTDSFTPKITEFETKIKEYEAGFQRVMDFEKTMLNEPEKFLALLASNIPAYKELFSQYQAPGAAAAQPAQPAAPAVPAQAEMPQPDQKLPDGSMVYSMDGLKSLLAWQQNQIEAKAQAEIAKATTDLSTRYKGMEEQWKAQQIINEAAPKVQAQINEARTWPLFNENEAEITKALQADRNLSLEGAYRKVVFPKITSDRNKIREEVLKEVAKAPKATSAPASVSRPNVAPSGPRSLEDVIADSIKALK